MSVLVNFKICDNAKECGGIAVCPTKALSYDEKKGTIVIDNNKCISCGLCEKECPIGAIAVAKTKEEHCKIQNDIDNDPRTTKDLFVDRYGAAPLSEFFMLDANKIDSKISSNGITLIELYCDDTIECLLKSIPIKDLTKDLDKNTLFYKIACDKNLMKKYEITTLPSLLIFKDGKLLGNIDGYYTNNEKEELLEKIKKILN